MESTKKSVNTGRTGKADVLNGDNQDLESKLQAQIEEAKRKDLELQRLKAALVQKDGQLDVYKYQSADFSRQEKKIWMPKALFFTLISVLVCLAGFAAYSWFFKEEQRLTGSITYAASSPDDLDASDSLLLSDEPLSVKTPKSEQTSDPKSISAVSNEDLATSKTVNNTAEQPRKSDPKEIKVMPAVKSTVKIDKPAVKTVLTEKKSDQTEAPAKKVIVADVPAKGKVIEPKTTASLNDDDDPNYIELPPEGKYYINVARAYLYDQADLGTKGYYFMAPSNSSILFSMDEKNGFIYIEFTNGQGKLARGWVKKSDLVKIN